MATEAAETLPLELYSSLLSSSRQPSLCDRQDGGQ